MPLPRAVEQWRERAEIDHIGPFVKAWAAFNAWFRHVSQTTSDRQGIDHIRSRPNSVKNAILPYLDPQTQDTPEASEFKGHIAALHSALESYRLETDNKGRLEHISFRSVPIAGGRPLPQQKIYRNISYRVEKPTKHLWLTTIIDRTGVEIFRFEQERYNLKSLIEDPGYGSLSPERLGQLRALYIDCDPRPMSNLLVGSEPPILVGTIPFRCACDDLFAGVIENIYRMRNMLLHGELEPDPAALAGFEHAFLIVRHMLRECR